MQGSDEWERLSFSKSPQSPNFSPRIGSSTSVRFSLSGLTTDETPSPSSERREFSGEDSLKDRELPHFPIFSSSKVGIIIWNLSLFFLNSMLMINHLHSHRYYLPILQLEVLNRRPLQN